MSTAQPFKKLIKSDAIIIGFLTVFANLVPFLYELGYFLFFGIPLHLIEFDLRQVLLATSLGLGVAVGIVAYVDTVKKYNLYVEFAKTRRELQGNLLTIFIPLIVAAVIVCNILSADLLFGVILIVSIAFTLAYPFIAFPHKDTPAAWYVLNQEKKRIKESEKKESEFFLAAEKLLGSAYVFIIDMFVLASLLSFGAGYMQASFEQKFYVVEGGKEGTAIVRVYRDLLIGVGYSTTTKQFTGEIELIQPGTTTTLKKETLGRLGVPTHLLKGVYR